jgi:hypothetical protein
MIFFSGCVIFIGLAVTCPMGVFGSFVAFCASFLTGTAIWCSRTDENKKFWKWILQGWASSPATLFGHHLAKNCCQLDSQENFSFILAGQLIPPISILAIIW